MKRDVMYVRDKDIDCHDIITSDDYIDVIDVGASGDFKEGVCIQELASQIEVVHLKRKQSCVKGYLTIPVMAIRLPNVFGITTTKGSKENASKITAGKAFSSLGLTGTGVLIGIMDTGIDYTHEAFVYQNGYSKIVSIWDQTQKGTPPKGLLYGVEYTREQINEALKADDPYSIVPEKDEVGHGTFMAGVAAGRIKEAERFSSMAPNAELVVVKLKQAKKCLQEFFFTGDEVAFQDTDVLMAMKYLFEKSRELDKPIVILFAGQSYIGAHTSSDVDPIEILASNYGRANGVVFAFGAGDQADKGLHYKGQFIKEEKKIQEQKVQFNVGPDEQGLAFNIWVKEPDQLTINLISPRGSETGKIPYKSNVIQEYTFVLENTVVVTDFFYRQRFGGQQALYIRIENPTEGIWTMEVSGDKILSGEFNIWLGISEFLVPTTAFLYPDPNITVVIPSTSESIITVGAYSPANEGVYIPSGRGFTVDNSVKPDITAPGVNIIGPVPDNNYEAMSGTAISTAVAAGGIALLLEWGIVNKHNTSINTLIAKSYLIGGAKRSDNIVYPSKDSGYGQMDIYNSIISGI